MIRARPAIVSKGPIDFLVVEKPTLAASPAGPVRELYADS
jgi:hypothetical protein